MRPRIGLIADDISHGLSYQRGHLFFRHLKQKYEFVPIDFNTARETDYLYLDAAIFLHPYRTEHLTQIFRLKQQYQIPSFVDMDDLTNELPSDHPFFYNFKSNVVNNIISSTDHMVVSTQWLKRKWFHLNRNITVIENAVDERRYDGFKNIVKPYHSGFIVGYTGGTTHRADFYNSGFLDGMIEFMDKYPEVRAYFHINCPQVLLDKFGVRIIFNENIVSYMDYPALCATFPFDICVAPLHNHPFNDAKSDLRLLDMAPFDIPVMASPRHEFKRHEGTGRLLLAKDGEWFPALRDAFLNRISLPDISRTAREYVFQERLSVDGAKQWDQLLNEALKTGTHSKNLQPMISSNI